MERHKEHFAEAHLWLHNRYLFENKQHFNNSIIRYMNPMINSMNNLFCVLCYLNTIYIKEYNEKPFADNLLELVSAEVSKGIRNRRTDVGIITRFIKIKTLI